MKKDQYTHKFSLEANGANIVFTCMITGQAALDAVAKIGFQNRTLREEQLPHSHQPQTEGSDGSWISTWIRENKTSRNGVQTLIDSHRKRLAKQFTRDDIVEYARKHFRPYNQISGFAMTYANRKGEECSLFLSEPAPLISGVSRAVKRV